jgi:hypothetical protein
MKSQPAVTNLLRQPEPFAPIVDPQCQAHAIYFDFNSAFDLLLNALHLHKLTNYGPSAGCGNCFRRYTTITIPHACYCKAVSSTDVSHKEGTLWNRSFSKYVLMTCVMYTDFQITFFRLMT